MPPSSGSVSSRSDLKVKALFLSAKSVTQKLIKDYFLKFISHSNYRIYQSYGFLNYFYSSHLVLTMTNSHMLVGTFSLHLAVSSLVSLEDPTLFRLEISEEIYSSPPNLQQQTHGLFATSV